MIHESWDLVPSGPGTIPAEWASQVSISPPWQGQVEKDSEQGRRADIQWGGRDRKKGEPSPWQSHQKGLRRPLSTCGVDRGQAVSHNTSNKRGQTQSTC